MLETAPERVTFTFNESVIGVPAGDPVFDATGAEVASSASVRDVRARRRPRRGGRRRHPGRRLAARVGGRSPDRRLAQLLRRCAQRRGRRADRRARTPTPRRPLLLSVVRVAGLPRPARRPPGWRSSPSCSCPASGPPTRRGAGSGDGRCRRGRRGSSAGGRRCRSSRSTSSACGASALGDGATWSALAAEEYVVPLAVIVGLGPRGAARSPSAAPGPQAAPAWSSSAARSPSSHRRSPGTRAPPRPRRS